MWLWYGTFLDKYQYGMWPTAHTKLDASVVYSDTLLLDSYWCILHSALTPILAAIKLLMRKQEDPDSRCKWAGGWGEPSAICQAHLVYRALCKVQLSPDKPQTPPPPILLLSPSGADSLSFPPHGAKPRDVHKSGKQALWGRRGARGGWTGKRGTEM